MKVIIFLMTLLSFQMFSQTTVTKYRINLSDIKKNLNQIKTEFEEVEDHDENYLPFSRETVSNFYLFLELGERIDKIKLNNGDELDPEVLQEMKEAIEQIKLNPYQTQQTIDGLEGLLIIFEFSDTIYLNDNMAIKLIDENTTRKERKSYKKIRLKGLKNLLRASGGVSSGGGGA